MTRLLVRSMLVLTCLFLITPLTAQEADEEQPFLPANLAVITPENVDDLQLIAELGNGLLLGAHMTDAGDLVLATTRGAVIYPDGDLNTAPDLVPFDPNPFADRYYSFLVAPSSLNGDTLTVRDVALNLTTGETVVGVNEPEDQRGVLPFTLPDRRTVNVELVPEDNNNVDLVIFADDETELGRLERAFCIDRGEPGVLLHPDSETIYLYKTAIGAIAAFDVSGDVPVKVGERGAFRLFPPDAAFSADSLLLYSVQANSFPICSVEHPEQGVAVYDLSNGSQADLLASDGIPNSVAASSSGLVLMTEARTISLWADGEPFVEDSDDDWNFLMHDATFSPDGRYAAAFTTSTSFQVWDSAGERVVSFDDARNSFFSRKGDVTLLDEKIVYAGDAMVIVRSLPDGEEIDRIPLGDQVNGMAYNAATETLAVMVGFNRGPDDVKPSIQIYDMSGENPLFLREFEGLREMENFTFSPDGSLLAFTHPGGDVPFNTFPIPALVIFYDVATGEIVGGIEDDSGVLVEFSSDGRLLVTWAGSGDVALYGIPGG